jgi:hypothetical protein
MLSDVSAQSAGQSHDSDLNFWGRFDENVSAGKRELYKFASIAF